MEKIFENQYGVIYNLENEIEHVIFAIWRGYLLFDTPEAIKVCQVSLDYIKEAGIKVMISDHSGLEGASVEFLDWIQSYYFPTAVENGLLSEIVLDSAHLLGSVSLDLMYDTNDMQKHLKNQTLYTPKIDTIENAKLLANQIIQQKKIAH